MYFKTNHNNILGIHFLSEYAYSFNSTFFRFIYLTAKSLRRVTMRSFLVGVTKPEPTVGAPGEMHSQTSPTKDSRIIYGI